MKQSRHTILCHLVGDQNQISLLFLVSAHLKFFQGFQEMENFKFPLQSLTKLAKVAIFRVLYYTTYIKQAIKVVKI